MGAWGPGFSSPLALTPGLQRPLGTPDHTLPIGSNKLPHKNHSAEFHTIKCFSMLTNRCTHVERGHCMAAPMSCLSIPFPPTAWLKCPPPSGSLPDCTSLISQNHCLACNIYLAPISLAPVFFFLYENLDCKSLKGEDHICTLESPMFGRLHAKTSGHQS